MKLNYMFFSADKNLPKTYTSQLRNEPSYTYPENLIFPNRELVIAIDPGTSKTGLVILDANTKSFLTIMTISREKTSSEPTADHFVYTFAQLFLRDLIIKNKVKEIIMESQYIDPRYKHSYSVLNGFVRTLKSLMTTFGVPNLEVAPQTWKSTLFENYSRRKSIDLRKSNKDHVMFRAREMIRQLMYFPQGDGYDAFGIAYYYIQVISKPTDKNTLIEVKANMQLDFKQDIVMTIKAIDITASAQDIIKAINNHTALHKGKRVLYKFKPYEGFTAEENIRALMRGNNDMYLGLVKPYAKIFPELFRNRDNIKGPIKEDTMLLIFGYRSKLLELQ